MYCTQKTARWYDSFQMYPKYFGQSGWDVTFRLVENRKFFF